jgi:hypothetical protein
MEWISSLFLMSYAQRSRTSFFNTCMHKSNFGFLQLNIATSLNMTTRLRGHGPSWPPSLVFVFYHISTSIVQNPKFFFYARIEEGCSAPLTIAHETQI